MIEKIYADFAWEQAAELLAIDSPSGYTAKAAQWVKEAFEKIRFSSVEVDRSSSQIRAGSMPMAVNSRNIHSASVISSPDP